jgi:formate hydrogenlyase transcriptional activator
MFLQESGQRLGKRFTKLSRDKIEGLCEYGWPGNVRELENVIARAAIFSNPPTLQLPDGWNRGLESLTPANIASTVGEAAPPTTQVGRAKSPMTLEEFKRKRIIEVLRQTNWRIEGPKGAALILGLHPNTLRSQLAKLGLKPSELRNSVVETTK